MLSFLCSIILFVPSHASGITTEYAQPTNSRATTYINIAETRSTDMAELAFIPARAGTLKILASAKFLDGGSGTLVLHIEKNGYDYTFPITANGAATRIGTMDVLGGVAYFYKVTGFNNRAAVIAINAYID